MKHEETRAVLISLRPEYAQRIYAGTKVRELRKVLPDLKPGTTVLVYESGKRRSISGWFKVGGIDRLPPDELWNAFSSETGLAEDEFRSYCGNSEVIAAIRIDSPSQFQCPIALRQMRELDPEFNPPQNFRYLTSLPKRLLELIRGLFGGNSDFPLSNQSAGA